MQDRTIRLFGNAKNPVQPQHGYSAIKLILMVTVGVFVLQLLTTNADGGSVIFDWFALEQGLVFRAGQCWRLLTYGLLHSTENVMHIACNMLALFFLGRVVSLKTGNREFIAIYVASTILAGMMQASAQAIVAPGAEAWTIGASGAVMCIFVMFTMWYPRVKLYLFGIVGIKAQWLLGGVLAYDFLGLLGVIPSLSGSEGASIGHAAHLGGAIFGFLYIRSEMNLTAWWNQLTGRRSPNKANKPSLKVYNPGTQPEVNFTDRVDRILDKITSQGEDSLTDRERRVLRQASQHIANSR